MGSIAFATIKGGGGKTTLAGHTATAPGDAGKSVLFIDLHPQAHRRPVPSGAFALEGLSEIERAWREVRETGGELVAAVNQWDRRTQATNEAMEGALAQLTVPLLRTRIPRSEAINQAGLSYEVVFDTA